MIRPSRVAGSFYPGNATRLSAEIQMLLSEADAPDCGSILAAAVPHAGYVYSAAIAAPVFKAMEKVSFDTIVIIGHEFGRHAPGVMAVLPEDTIFRTPLGDVPVDTELCNELLKADSRIVVSNQAHRQEHTIEVQLPFLQSTHDNFKILPVLFGEVTTEHCVRFAELLEKLAGNRSIFVLSSTDLSHYPPEKVARQLDAKTVAFAERFDVQGLCEWKEADEWQGLPGVETPICSAGGLAVAMTWAHRHGATKTIVMKRGTSYDAGGDATRVVGYSSMLFAK